MAHSSAQANAAVFKKASAFVLLLLLTIPLCVQTPKIQAAAPDAGLEEKATSFLKEVIQLDLTKYTLTLNQRYSESQHLFFNVKLANASAFDFGLDGDAIFSFTNGTLSTCHLSLGYRGIIYQQPELDSYNSTLGMVERYYTWTNDSQVQEMANLLRKVGSEKNATETQDNLTLRISDSPFVQYGFYNTYNGVDYTGLKIFRGGSNLMFDDSRVSQKIGDTNINVSSEQAVAIAQDYLKTYVYNSSFPNGTHIAITNLNVTGVYSVKLQSTIRENSTLYPYWDVMLNVSNLPARGLQGMGVRIWANDGTVSFAYPFSNLNIASLVPTLLLLPILSGWFLALLFAVFCAVIIIVVLVVVLRKDDKATTVRYPAVNRL